MVRKYFAALAAVTVLLLNGVIYPTTGVITKIDYEADKVYVTNATNFTYDFEGVEDLMVGDVMSLIMYSHNTPEISDDEIISARYSGFISSEILQYNHESNQWVNP